MMQPTEYVHPFEGLDLNWLLAMQASERGDHPFIVFEPFDRPPVVLSYRYFYRQVIRLAQGLLARGIRRGDRVIIHLDNCPEFLLSWCACGLIGAIAVTTNTRSSEEELSYFASHSEAVAAITQPRLVGIVRSSCSAVRWIAITDNDSGEPCADADRPARAEEFARLLVDDEAAALPTVGPDAPLGIQYTSGTTSRPKAVLWTHANALWAARTSATHEALRPQDIHHCVLPLFHTNALSYSWLACLWAGATLVLQPRFSSSRFWDVALRNRCTWSSITAFCYRALANGEIPQAHFFRNWGVAFSDPLVIEKFGIRPLSWWGMTETLSQGIIGFPHMPIPFGAIGRPAPEYDIRILDPDGRPVELGQTGALYIRGIRGISLFREYFRNEEATAAAFGADGLFNTGDQVTRLPDGSIRFADRTKDMLKVGGENVASLEIERVVNAIDGIEESAVIACPHPMLDEVPVAFVRVGAALSAWDEAAIASQVMTACRAKLADFKVPREVYVIDEFPRATIGKIAKARLKEMRQARVGDRAS
jgi:crotonobetaine/carnitine-CoA ligase